MATESSIRSLHPPLTDPRPASKIAFQLAMRARPTDPLRAPRADPRSPTGRVRLSRRAAWREKLPRVGDRPPEKISLARRRVAWCGRSVACTSVHGLIFKRSHVPSDRATRRAPGDRASDDRARPTARPGRPTDRPSDALDRRPGATAGPRPADPPRGTGGDAKTHLNFAPPQRYVWL